MTTAETKGGGTGSETAVLGSLAHTPFAQVVLRIAQQGLSGDLQVTTPSAIKTVYFDRGFIVFASSNLKSDRLGESMIEAGRISRHEFALASMVMKSSKRKFGETLVQAGILSEEELGHSVATQVNRIVLSLFSAKTGMYSFDERPCSIPVELMVSLSVYRILLEGIRRMTSKKLVLGALPPLDSEWKIAADPPFTLDVEKLRPVEKEVLRAAGRGSRLSGILKAVGGNDGVTLRAVYGLWSAGVLEAVESTPGSRLLRVQEETGTFVLSEIRRKVEAKGPPAPTPSPTPSPIAPIDENAPEPVVEWVKEEEDEPSPPLRLKEEPRVLPVAEPPPPPAPHPTPSRPAAMEPVPVGGPMLQRLLGWAKRLWKPIENALLRFVGSSPEKLEIMRAEGPPPSLPRHRGMGEATPPHADAPHEAHGSGRSPAAVPVPEPDEDEDVGVPSWSILSTPEMRAEDSSADGDDREMGVPSWSMKDDPTETAETASRLGIPPWSAKDAPEDSRPAAPSARVDPPGEGGRPSTDLRGQPPIERMEAPIESWEEPHESTEPLSELDSELFIEEEVSEADEPSMLSHIPVEEITVHEEPFEIEFEIDEDALQGMESAGEVPPERVEVVQEAVIEKEAGPKDEPPRRVVHEERVEEKLEAPSPDSATVARAPEAVEKASPAPPPEAPPEREEFRHKPPSERDDAMRRAKQSGGESRLFRDVKLHFKLRDWEGAVPLLEQLVQISPGSALYRGMLARAMSKVPMMRKDAEEHFIEALRLAPQDAELHYWLGLYYKSFGLKSRALTEFRTTLRIDPRHDGARQQLSGGRNKDDAIGTVFKKIFG